MPPEGRIGDLAAYFNRKAQEAKEAIRKTLYGAVISAGGLRVQDDGAFEIVTSAGVYTLYAKKGADGKREFGILRDDGSFVLRTFSTAGGQAWALHDKFNRVSFADDADTGGIARPWLTVSLYPLFAKATGLGYMDVAAASIPAETVLWEGRLPLVSHPRIRIDGIWGAASGSNTSTYKLSVGNTVVGAWDCAGLEVGGKGPFSIASMLDQADKTVQLRVSASGTGQVAVQPLSCYLRQT